MKVVVKQIKPKKGENKQKKAVKEKPVDLVLAKRVARKKIKRQKGPVFLRITRGQLVVQSPHLVDLKASEREALAKAQAVSPARSVKPRVWFRFRRKSLAPQLIPPRFNFQPKNITGKFDRWLVGFVQGIGFFLWKAYKSFPHFFCWLGNYLTGWVRAKPKIKLVIKPKAASRPAPKATPKCQPVADWSRPIINFVVIALLLVLPIWLLVYYQKLHRTGQEVLGITQVALSRLKLGGAASIGFDLTSAELEFSAAWQGFNLAQEQLAEVNGAVLGLLKLLPKEGKMVAAGEKLLSAGKDIALAGRYLAGGLEPIISNGNVDLSVVMALPVGELPLTEKIINLKNNFLLANAKIRSAQENLADIKTTILPKEHQETLNQTSERLSLIQKKTGAFISFVDFLSELLGHQQTKRYLLIFQNNAELRATGGFIGSLALIDIDRGQIKNIEIPGGGPYDLKAGFFENIISPEPLHLVNPRWELQDANWFPDFPTSAKKIIWFYGQAGGPSVDGVIALTPELIEKLIALVGPIDLTEKYGAVITKDNFIQFTQTESEKKYDETQTSKQFIADLAPLVLAKALKGESSDYLATLITLNQALQDKNLLFYFPDNDLQQKTIDYGWAGQLKDNPADYLAVIHSNISGGKTDLVMIETVDHLAEIDKDGYITDTLTITRQHQGIKDDPFTGYKNVDYLRVYVPQGSELISAKGFEAPAEGLFQTVPDFYRQDTDLTVIEKEIKIDSSSQTRITNEFGKTVFGNWVQTDLGETSMVTLKYRLPFRLPLERLNQPRNWWDNFKTDRLGIPEEMISYSLLLQKQPGSPASQFNHQLKFQFSPEVVWQYPADYRLAGDVWRAEMKIDGDKFFGLVFKE